jgi:hypothetical protein
MLDGKLRAEKMRRVIRACVNCHSVLDSLEHAETEQIVENVIKSRKAKVE